MPGPATPLGRVLCARIATQGPMPLSDYMAECLLNPQHGYYATRDPFGATGDFTTAPEISQMFGEMIGLCLAQIWLDQGSPERFVLAELGPGRGTLMADILRSFRKLPALHRAARPVLVEASATLKHRQAETLADEDVAWHDSIADLPEGPLYLIANEFFDALPIRQFRRDAAGWREVVVGLADDGRLIFGLTQPSAIAALAHRLADTRPGEVVELCPALPPIAAEAARRIAAHGGVALVIDYGGWRSLGDTLQALSGHAVADPLAAPGHADLTAHVDFEAISQAWAIPGIAVTAMVPQGMFLERLGITARAQLLAASLAGDRLESHIAAHRRLTHPGEMGNLFKVIGCHPAGTAIPPGLQPVP